MLLIGRAIVVSGVKSIANFIKTVEKCSSILNISVKKNIIFMTVFESNKSELANSNIDETFQPLQSFILPVDTRWPFKIYDVYAASPTSHSHLIDVETTSCVYRPDMFNQFFILHFFFHWILNFKGWVWEGWWFEILVIIHK